MPKWAGDSCVRRVDGSSEWTRQLGEISGSVSAGARGPVGVYADGLDSLDGPPWLISVGRVADRAELKLDEDGAVGDAASAVVARLGRAGRPGGTMSARARLCQGKCAKSREKKEERVMRYAVTALLALAVGITASAPAAHAQMVDRDGNEVVLLQPDGYAAISCYVDGAVVICVQPAPLTLPESQPGPKIGTTKPFTTEANFMSLPGYFRYLMHQMTGQWLTYGQAAGGRWLRP